MGFLFVLLGYIERSAPRTCAALSVLMKLGDRVAFLGGAK
jgi:hypothetical protein